MRAYQKHNYGMEELQAIGRIAQRITEDTKILALSSYMNFTPWNKATLGYFSTLYWLRLDGFPIKKYLRILLRNIRAIFHGDEFEFITNPYYVDSPRRTNVVFDWVMEVQSLQPQHVQSRYFGHIPAENIDYIPILVNSQLSSEDIVSGKFNYIPYVIKKRRKSRIPSFFRTVNLLRESGLSCFMSIFLAIDSTLIESVAFEQNLQTRASCLLTRKNIFIPYENQGWQKALAWFLSRKASPDASHLIGYIHSSVNNFPVNLFRTSYSPDTMLVHGRAFNRIFSEVLGWNPQQIIQISSLRYHRKFALERDTVFLPYTFHDEGHIFDRCLEAIRYAVKHGLSDFEIRQHPACVNLEKHRRLFEKLQDFRKNIGRIRPGSLQRIVIVVGVSTTLLESVQAGYRTIVVVEDEKDFYDPVIWKELDFKKINLGIAEYSLNSHAEQDCFIQIDKEFENEESKVWQSMLQKI